MKINNNNQYENLFIFLKAYSYAYGGWRGVFLSPLFHIAILITILTYPIWHVRQNYFCWFELSIAIIPNMLGFTLAAYAALMAFGSKKFIETMSGHYSDGNASPFLQTSAAFFHFIFIQLLALIMAILSKAYQLDEGLFAAVGMLLLSYSLFTGLGAAFAVFALTRLFDQYIEMLEEIRRNKNK